MRKKRPGRNAFHKNANIINYVQQLQTISTSRRYRAEENNCRGLWFLGANARSYYIDVPTEYTVFLYIVTRLIKNK